MNYSQIRFCLWSTGELSSLFEFLREGWSRTTRPHAPLISSSFLLPSPVLYTIVYSKCNLCFEEIFRIFASNCKLLNRRNEFTVECVSNKATYTLDLCRVSIYLVPHPPQAISHVYTKWLLPKVMRSWIEPKIM